MKTNADEKILEILKQIMKGTISPYQYSIEHHQEESICINYRNGCWITSLFERGTDHPICQSDNCFDACKIFLFHALPGERWLAKRQEFAERVQQEGLV